ncbi:MAG: DUF4292 domain-containing protein [Nitrospinaceae bacterium]
MSTRTSSPLLAAGLLLFVSFFLFSCQPKAKTVPPQSTIIDVSPEEILRHLTQRQAGVHDLKTFVRTTVQGPDLKQSFKQVLLVRGEHAIRLDTFGMFGQALGVFIYKNSNPLLYDLETDRMIRGPEVWEALEKMIGLSADFTDYIRVLTGGIPRIENLQVIDAPLSTDSTVYQLRARDDVFLDRVDIEVESSTLLPLKMVRRTRDRQVFEVHWEDYRRVGDWNFPHRVILSLSESRKSVTLKFSDPLLNVGVSPGDFELFQPGKTVSH